MSVPWGCPWLGWQSVQSQYGGELSHRMWCQYQYWPRRRGQEREKSRKVNLSRRGVKYLPGTPANGSTRYHAFYRTYKWKYLSLQLKIAVVWLGLGPVTKLPICKLLMWCYLYLHELLCCLNVLPDFRVYGGSNLRCKGLVRTVRDTAASPWVGTRTRKTTGREENIKIYYRLMACSWIYCMYMRLIPLA